MFMHVFNRAITFGLIKEIGEDDVLMQVGNEEFVVELPDEAKELVFKNAEEQIFIAPVDIVAKRIVLETRHNAIQEFS